MILVLVVNIPKKKFLIPKHIVSCQIIFLEDPTVALDVENKCSAFYCQQ